ncbi:MAG TPA: hypothetical protein VK117_07685 [Pyrinomonadaceae bacterium]|nr:hypothetical protein [Pyrinomonadaceae bacterium]
MDGTSPGDPALIERSATQPELENRFAKIAEFGDRVLRVVVTRRLFPNG